VTSQEDIFSIKGIFFLDQYANAYRIFIEGRKYIYKRWKHQQNENRRRRKTEN
jgi:hypothetical protein